MVVPFPLRTWTTVSLEEILESSPVDKAVTVTTQRKKAGPERLRLSSYS